MKSHTQYMTFNTKKKREYLNITGEVEEALSKSWIKEGLALISAMHITAGVYVNDAESGLIADIEDWLQRSPLPYAPSRSYSQTVTPCSEQQDPRKHLQLTKQLVCCN